MSEYRIDKGGNNKTHFLAFLAESVIWSFEKEWQHLIYCLSNRYLHIVDHVISDKQLLDYVHYYGHSNQKEMKAYHYWNFKWFFIRSQCVNKITKLHYVWRSVVNCWWIKSSSATSFWLRAPLLLQARAPRGATDSKLFLQAWLIKS